MYEDLNRIILSRRKNNGRGQIECMVKAQEMVKARLKVMVMIKLKLKVEIKVMLNKR
jgi:hypothetical protein